MTGQVRRASTALGLLALLLPGCMGWVNPIAKPAPQFQQYCEQIPAPCRQAVYVVFVNGADPLGCGNLSGVRQYLNGLGFVKSYYAQLYHEDCLLQELRRAHEEHADAKFAIIGFEYGANAARQLAYKAVEAGIAIDLVVLLQPKGLAPQVNVARPSLPRLITIQSGKESLDDPSLQQGEIVAVSSSTRYGVPTNAHTLEMLTTELTHLALRVPVIGPVGEAFPTILDDAPPTPRPLTAFKPAPPDEWDFLKPVSLKKSEK